MRENPLLAAAMAKLKAGTSADLTPDEALAYARGRCGPQQAFDDLNLCYDCGIDTTPCTGKRGCRHKGKWEWYMLTDEAWPMSPFGYLCIGCVENRIGRQLTPADFKDVPVNEPSPWDTDRLASRKGHARP
jgi:hypothetical protein